MSVQVAPVTLSTIVVAVDVGKTSAMLSVTDSARNRLFGPVEFAMTRGELAAIVDRVGGVVTACAQVKVGIEAAGHYHRPVLDYGWPPGWEVVELNPAHVAEQRRVAGRRRVKTDAIDLEAITELVLAGRDSRSLPRRHYLGRSARGRAIAAGGSRCARRRKISCSVNSTARFPG